MIQQMIRLEAERQGVDPSLALAVASAESDFDPSAVSRTGAIGVMQLMPRTAAWLARRLGRSVDRSNLADNIAAGVAFLRYLLAATSGDTPTAVAAYYQGLDSVRRDGLFPDTAAYVQKVTTRRAQYAQEGPIVN
jgi:soluble lytic murein transglycosylase-like protein